MQRKHRTPLVDEYLSGHVIVTLFPLAGNILSGSGSPWLLPVVDQAVPWKCGTLFDVAVFSTFGFGDIYMLTQR
jgi:hypothetical protein